jgi:WhiB family redox-sensing transcriptional regulator
MFRTPDQLHEPTTPDSHDEDDAMPTPTIPQPTIAPMIAIPASLAGVGAADGLDERKRQRPPGASGVPTRRPVARCADGNGTMTGLFFSDDMTDIARAKAMCGLCPLRVSCLAEALEREEPWGVWGGELLSGGRIVQNKRPCGRPPKRPRPVVVIDELGPVAVA